MISKVFFAFLSFFSSYLVTFIITSNKHKMKKKSSSVILSSAPYSPALWVSCVEFYFLCYFLSLFKQILITTEPCFLNNTSNGNTRRNRNKLIKMIIVRHVISDCHGSTPQDSSHSHSIHTANRTSSLTSRAPGPWLTLGSIGYDQKEVTGTYNNYNSPKGFCVIVYSKTWMWNRVKLCLSTLSCSLPSYFLLYIKYIIWIWKYETIS